MSFQEKSRPANQSYVLWACGLLTMMSVGCGTPANYVLIDNTSSETIVVEVNGQTVVEIPPKKYESIRCMPGEYEFRVTVNDKEIYKSQQTLEASKHFLKSRCYLLNPTGDTRYTVCNIRYEANTIRSMASQGALEGLITLAEHSYGKKVDPVYRQFVELKRYTKPMPATSWFEYQGASLYTFQQPPASVISRNGSFEQRSVLTRISQSDHRELLRTHSLKKPSLEDVKLLYQATARAIESISLLAPSSSQRAQSKEG